MCLKVLANCAATRMQRYDFAETYTYVDELISVVHVLTYEPYPMFPTDSFLTGTVAHRSSLSISLRELVLEYKRT
jgi:hypothetical protein